MAAIKGRKSSNSANGKKRKAEASSADKKKIGNSKNKKNQKTGKNDDSRKRSKAKPTGVLSEYELQEGYDPEVSDEDVDFVESLGKSAHGSSFLQALGEADFRSSGGVDRKVSECSTNKSVPLQGFLCFWAIAA